MFASIEHMLCGLPVVSRQASEGETPSLTTST